jgi:hypothetical protein
MTDTNHLALYDGARAALSKAVAVDEVKNIRDKAVAIKLYAKQAKDRELEANAYELRARAERRLGQMMEEGKDQRAGQGGDRRSKDSKKPLKPTLDEAGIDKNLAHRARSAAAMSDEAFADHVEMSRGGILHPAFEPSYPETKEQKAERLAERREFRKKRREQHRKLAEEKAEDEPAAAPPAAGHWVQQKITVEQRHADHEKLDDDQPVAAPPDRTNNGKSAAALAEFKFACRQWLPKLNRKHLEEAIAFLRTTFATGEEEGGVS